MITSYICLYKWKLSKEKYTYCTSPPREICTAKITGFIKLHVSNDTILPIMITSYKIKQWLVKRTVILRLYVYQKTNTVLNDSLWIVYCPVILYRILTSCMDFIIAGESLHNLRLFSAFAVIERVDVFNILYLLWYWVLFYTVFLEGPPNLIPSYDKLGIIKRIHPGF